MNRNKTKSFYSRRNKTELIMILYRYRPICDEKFNLSSRLSIFITSFNATFSSSFVFSQDQTMEKFNFVETTKRTLSRACMPPLHKDGMKNQLRYLAKTACCLPTAQQPSNCARVSYMEIRLDHVTTGGDVTWRSTTGTLFLRPLHVFCIFM
jgi:hypothetical protein